MKTTIGILSTYVGMAMLNEEHLVLGTALCLIGLAILVREVMKGGMA